MPTPNVSNSATVSPWVCAWPKLAGPREAVNVRIVDNAPLSSYSPRRGLQEPSATCRAGPDLREELVRRRRSHGRLVGAAADRGRQLLEQGLPGEQPPPI